MQGAAAQAMSVHIVEPPQPGGRMGLAGDSGDRALRTTERQNATRKRVRYASSPHFHSPIWNFARSGTLRVNTHARGRL